MRARGPDSSSSRRTRPPEWAGTGCWRAAHCAIRRAGRAARCARVSASKWRDHGGAEQAHRRHGDALLLAPRIDRAPAAPRESRRRLQPSSSATRSRLRTGSRRLRRLAAWRPSRSARRAPAALAENLHGEVPHGLEAERQAGQVFAAQIAESWPRPISYRRWPRGYPPARDTLRSPRDRASCALTPPVSRTRAAAGAV